LIRQEQKLNNFFKKTALVFSVNEISDAGLFDKSVVNLAGLDPGAADLPKYLHNNKCSLLKTGIQFSDAVMISSYEKRLKSLSQPKTDVEKIVAQAKNIFDVPNGANHQLWNPNSNALTKSYTAEKYYRRKANREGFIEDRRSGFKIDEMIVGILTEQFDQDAADIVDFLKSIKDIPMQILLITDKNPSSHTGYKQHTAKTPGHRVHTIVDPDDQMKPLFYAVCDLFYTPGTDYFSQRHNLNGIHYGSIPILAKQSDVSALFEPIKTKTMNGHALIFETKKEIASLLGDVQTVFMNTEKWDAMIMKIIKYDLSWNRSLPQVVKVYEKALSRLK
jgi:glycogen synthase